MLFTNLQTPEVQGQIKNFCAGKSGVYRITHLQSKKTYISSAITKKDTGNPLYVRFRNHFFNCHKEFPIKRAIKKYGVSAFSWEILEFTTVLSTRTRETAYLQKHLPAYNILKIAENSSGYKHSLLTREKMKNYSESRKYKIGALNKGKNLSLE